MYIYSIPRIDDTNHLHVEIQLLSTQLQGYRAAGNTTVEHTAQHSTATQPAHNSGAPSGVLEPSARAVPGSRKTKVSGAHGAPEIVFGSHAAS
jgi:hypothetical protein